MTGKEQLLELLRDEKTQTKGVDWAAKREEWVGSLRQLMAQLKAWLSVAESEGLLAIRDTSYSLSEDRLGAYSSPGLVIETPSGRKVEVKPHALVVIGARGRVDLESGPNRATILRMETGGWHLATREAGAVRTLPLTDETFSETLWTILS